MHPGAELERLLFNFAWHIYTPWPCVLGFASLSHGLRYYLLRSTYYHGWYILAHTLDAVGLGVAVLAVYISVCTYT